MLLDVSFSLTRGLAIGSENLYDFDQFVQMETQEYPQNSFQSMQLFASFFKRIDPMVFNMKKIIN